MVSGERPDYEETPERSSEHQIEPISHARENLTERAAETSSEGARDDERESQQKIEELQSRIQDLPNHPRQPITQEQQQAMEYSKVACEDVLTSIIDTFGSPKEGEKSPQLIHTAGPKSHFHDEIWMRDTSFAVLKHLGKAEPEAVRNTLQVIFDHQREDGALPLRVEKVRHWGRYIPGLNKIKAFIERSKPFAVYENIRGALPARDTVPAAVMASYETFNQSQEGRDLITANWEKLQKAVEREEQFEKDGLISGEKLQDWADSVMRDGKLADVNILYYHSLREMGAMADKINKKDEAKGYFDKARDVEKKIIDTFWDEEKGFFRAEEGSDRLDTPANIFACMYLVDSEKAVRIQDSIKSRVVAPSGLLKNFDPPYSSEMIAGRYKLGQIEDYHNNFTWPWVTCQNIQAKLKIAQEHKDEAVRERFENEALADFARVSEVFEQNQELNEILDPETARPIERSLKFGPISIPTYKSSPAFLATASSYAGARKMLESMKLIEGSKQVDPAETP